MASMGTLTEAVAATLAALAEADPERVAGLDAAACALALRFAEEIDGARAAQRRAEALTEQVRTEHGSDSALYERVDALARALNARAALDRIGARLQTALEALRATPKARGVTAGSPTASTGALGALRAVSGGRA